MDTAVTQALIDPQPPAELADQVAGVHAAFEEQMGYVPDGLRLYGISPVLQQSFANNVQYFSSHPNLSQRLLAMIRYLVSARQSCAYCVDFNETLLVESGLDLGSVRRAREYPEGAPLPARDRVLLLLVLRALEDPRAIGAQELEAARSRGWSDRDIFDAVVVAASNRAFGTVLKTFDVEHEGNFA
ncbi:MAG: hypothetical protein ABFS23_08290 [Pseudomonadota bacterium]